MNAPKEFIAIQLFQGGGPVVKLRRIAESM